MITLIKNAHIISPDREILNGSILVSHGFIDAVYNQHDDLPAADITFDAEGQFAFPGFIDIHAHGADGKDVCDNKVDSISHIAEMKLREGVTTWLPTTLTQPKKKLLEITETIAQYRTDQKFTKTPGMHIEGPFINASKAGAQNPEFVRKPNLDEIIEMHAIVPALILSIAPCLPNACEVIAGAKSLGISSSAAHSEASYSQLLAAKNAGLTHLTHYGNAMTGLHHREIGMVGAGLIDDDIYIEIICDGIHLDPDFLKLIFKVKSIDQIMMITDSMAGSWLNNGECTLGGLDVIVKNKVARLKNGGALAGSTLLFNEGFAIIAKLIDLPLHQIVKATSWNQAQSLGLEKHGKIEVGYTGDIAILNRDFKPTATFVDGQQRF